MADPVKELVSLRRPLERERARDDRLQSSRSELIEQQFHEGRHATVLGPEMPDVQPEHGAVGVDERERLEPRQLPPGAERLQQVPAHSGSRSGHAEHHESAERCEHAVARGEAPAAERIEDHINAAAARDRLDLAFDVRRAVIDEVLHSKRVESRVFRGRGCADDRRAPEGSELHGGDTNTAAGILHEHGLAGRDVRQAVQRQHGREIVHGQRGPLGVTQLARRGEHLVDRRHDRVRVPAEARQRGDSIAWDERRDAVTDSVDQPGHFVANHHRRLRRVGVKSDSGQDVGEVHAGCAHPDADFARAGMGVGRFLYLQDFRPAVAQDGDLPHRE
jgi:hypothetical protein